MRSALSHIGKAGSRFLVAGRLDDKSFVTLSEASIASEFSELFEELPEDEFREDISSSELRASRQTSE